MLIFAGKARYRGEHVDHETPVPRTAATLADTVTAFNRRGLAVRISAKRCTRLVLATQMKSARRAALSAAVLLTLCGCSLYRPLPLNARPPASLATLSVPASTIYPGGLKTHAFDPSDGLDATEVAMLAVVQSPDLKIQRAQAKVTRAQAFAAGLLPDPVLGLSRDRPNANQAGASTASTSGLSWDVGNLVTYASRQTAARRTNEQVNLALLWAEWQTVSESRLRFAHVQRGRELVARLEVESAALSSLAPRLNAALKRGVVTFDVATVGLSGVSDIQRQLSDARAALSRQEQDLRNLLGLPADEPLMLVGDVDVPVTDDAAASAAIDALPKRRPDLRALVAGYDAQEASVRAAILGQFPAVNFGVTKTRDNTNILSRGFSLSISLPSLNANRGAIRVERATREQLNEEYAQRLLTARADVARLLALQHILLVREGELDRYATQLQGTTFRASDAYERGTMDWTIYLGLRQSALAIDVELNALRLMLAETRIGLNTLLGGEWAAPSKATPGG